MGNPGGVRSIAWRAALALGLMFGFYALALAMAAALVAVPLIALSYSKNWAFAKLAIFCGVGAFLILRAILPRRDRFEEPGPALTPGEHPRLFAELRQIAGAVAQPMPAEVYLIPDVNAWVAHRGGFMGVGAREVMGLGLPLLQALRVSELRAVVAHEFGHYVGGDVRLGPWVYKTREALLRTVRALAGHSGFLAAPFNGYATLFFRVSHAVSRHQELQADALSAQVAGPAAAARGLREIHRATVAFQAYWNELGPVLGAGFLPPVAGGFARFMAEPPVADGVRQALDHELREGKQDPFDTHPCLRDRLAALPSGGETPERAPVSTDPPALALLEDVAGVERRLVEHLAGQNGPGKFAVVSWEDVPAAVHLPSWRKFLGERGAGLAGVTPAALPALKWAALGRKVEPSVDDAETAGGVAAYAVGAALAVALVDRGFVLDPGPTLTPRLARDGLRLEPFALRSDLGEEGGAARWATFCAEAGIDGLDLGAVVPRVKVPR